MSRHACHILLVHALVGAHLLVVVAVLELCRIGGKTAYGTRHTGGFHPTGGVAVARNDRGILDLTRDAAHLRNTLHDTGIVTIFEVVLLEHAAYNATHLVATFHITTVEGGKHMAHGGIGGGMHPARDTASAVPHSGNQSCVEAVGNKSVLRTVTGNTARKIVARRHVAVVSAAVNLAVFQSTRNTAYHVPAIHWSLVETSQNPAVLMEVVKLSDNTANGIRHKTVIRIDGTAPCATIGDVVELFVCPAEHTRDAADAAAVHIENGRVTYTVLHDGMVGEVVQVLTARITGNTADILVVHRSRTGERTVTKGVVQDFTSIVVADNTADIIHITRHRKFGNKTGIDGTESVVATNTTQHLAGIGLDRAVLGITTEDSAIEVSTAHQAHTVASQRGCIRANHLTILNGAAKIVTAHHSAVITGIGQRGRLELEILHRTGGDIAKEALIVFIIKMQSGNGLVIAIEVALEYLIGLVSIVVADRSPRSDRRQVYVLG